MARYVITGSTGLIGAHLVRALQSSHTVYSVARQPAPSVNDSGRVIPVSLNLATSWSSDALPPGPMDAVIHLAQSEHFRDFPNSALPVFEVNTMTTLKLLDYAHRVGAKTFIYASSGGIYDTGAEPCSEAARIFLDRDLGFYINTKLCSEMLVKSYAAHLTVIILRFFFVYGPGQRSSMLVPRLVESVAQGRPMTLQGEQGLQINPTHVSDAVHSIQQALGLTESHIINIGGPNVLSLREIGNVIGRHLNRPPQFTCEPHATSQDLVGDIQKMTDLLGPPQMTFDAGIQQYIAQTYPSLAVPV
jgi:UDP-glucose 4-epimerase